MIIRQSKVFGRPRREAPSDAEAISHKLLVRAGYIDQLASGIFSFLPLGWRVVRAIEDIIRREMHAIDAHELLLPALQPAALWSKSGRLTTMDPPLFRLTDRHDRELVLASTHEEVITQLAAEHIASYKDLPLAAFQIQTKFRNEVRATGGLLRVREFSMKDLYSFHASTEDLETYYEAVKQAYLRIFVACDVPARAVEADSGSIGGRISHEFSVEAPTGEDKVLVCTSCDYAANSEKATARNECPQCGGTLAERTCIENGHIFQLGTTYSEKLGAVFTDQAGQQQPVLMGCYGIGIGRLMATIVETHADDKGLVWPGSVSPYRLHLIPLQTSVIPAAQKYADALSVHGDILFDDRDLSVGQKLAEADLIGIATRVIVSEKTEAAGNVEVVQRADLNKQLLTFAEAKQLLSAK